MEEGERERGGEVRRKGGREIVSEVGRERMHCMRREGWREGEKV